MHPKLLADMRNASGGHGEFPTLLVPLEPAFRAIGVGRTKGYALTAAGQLTMVKIGGKSLVTADSLRQFAASLLPARTPAKH